LHQYSHVKKLAGSSGIFADLNNLHVHTEL